MFEISKVGNYHNRSVTKFVSFSAPLTEANCIWPARYCWFISSVTARRVFTSPSCTMRTCLQRSFLFRIMESLLYRKGFAAAQTILLQVLYASLKSGSSFASLSLSTHRRFFRYWQYRAYDVSPCWYVFISLIVLFKSLPNRKRKKHLQRTMLLIFSPNALKV